MNDFKQISIEFLTKILDGVLLVSIALLIALLILIPIFFTGAEIAAFMGVK